MRTRPIIISELDLQQLRRLLANRERMPVRDQVHLEELEAELARAQVLDAADVPGEVVALNSLVGVRDLRSGHRNQYELVLPNQANLARGRLSVLAPLGTAVLGYREGDELEWSMPGGLRRLLIERVVPPAHSGAAASAAVAVAVA